MATSEMRYDAVSTIKSIGLGLVPILLLLVVSFFDPPDFGTRVVRRRFAADAKRGGEESSNGEKRHLAIALEDFDRFCALVDSEATNTAAYGEMRRSAKSLAKHQDADLIAPHLSIDYSWNEELEAALLKMGPASCRTSPFRQVFSVPDEKELRLKLDGAVDNLVGIKEAYVRYRVFPFASDPWARWCMLTGTERKAVVKGPGLELAIWLSVVLGLGSLVYFFMVRHWCDKCWKSHWLWRCPHEMESENRGNLKGLLIAVAVFLGMFAFMGWRIVDWGNVAKTSRMLRSGLGESAELFCRASPGLMHSYQMELLEELDGFDRSLVPFLTGARSGSKPDLESDFIRIVALDDMFRAAIETNNQQ